MQKFMEKLLNEEIPVYKYQGKIKHMWKVVEVMFIVFSRAVHGLMNNSAHYLKASYAEPISVPAHAKLSVNTQFFHVWLTWYVNHFSHADYGGKQRKAILVVLK